VEGCCGDGVDGMMKLFVGKIARRGFSFASRLPNFRTLYNSQQLLLSHEAVKMDILEQRLLHTLHESSTSSISS
jgi:hypothetical protein